LGNWPAWRLTSNPTVEPSTSNAPTNEGIDRLLVSYDRILASTAHLYAGAHDLTNPLISPSTAISAASRPRFWSPGRVMTTRGDGVAVGPSVGVVAHAHYLKTNAMLAELSFKAIEESLAD